jgi:hypothetical protein
LFYHTNILATNRRLAAGEIENGLYGWIKERGKGQAGIGGMGQVEVGKTISRLAPFAFHFLPSTQAKR